MKQFDRVFQLHRRLEGRRVSKSVTDLSEELDCTPLTIKRTVRDMRDWLGAPLIFDQEQNGYRYDGEKLYQLPGLWFSADELRALLVLDEVLARQPLGILAEALRPIRKRLEELAQRSGIGIPEWRSRLRVLRMAARGVGEEFMRVAEGLANRRRLAIDYHARSSDRMNRRTVSPQRLVLYRDNWYLDAWCHAREDLRIFALDRVIAAEVLDAPAKSVDAAMVDAVLATSYGIFAGAPTALAKLRFSAQAARWVAAEVWHPEQQDERLEDGGLIRTVPYHRSEELVMDLLRHGSEVEVLEPTELRAAVVQRLRAALAQYAQD